jgi:hypothetical protein
VFERARDEAVLGLAGVELEAGPIGRELGPLEREPMVVQALFVLALELLDRARRGPHAGRGDRLQEGRGDRPVDAQAAERLAGPLGGVQLMAAHAGIAHLAGPPLPE